jgi:hypothetical protein
VKARRWEIHHAKRDISDCRCRWVDDGTCFWRFGANHAVKCRDAERNDIEQSCNAKRGRGSIDYRAQSRSLPQSAAENAAGKLFAEHNCSNFNNGSVRIEQSQTDARRSGGALIFIFSDLSSSGLCGRSNFV